MAFEVAFEGHDLKENLDEVQYVDQLREAVERLFNLFPESYEILDARGRVEKPEDLRRARQVGDVRVRELPAFRRIREISVEIGELHKEIRSVGSAQRRCSTDVEDCRSDMSALSGDIDEALEQVKGLATDVADLRVEVQRATSAAKSVELQLESAVEQIRRLSSKSWTEDLKQRVTDSVQLDLHRLQREVRDQVTIALQADAERVKEIAVLKGTLRLQTGELSSIRTEVDSATSGMKALSETVTDTIETDINSLRQELRRLQDDGASWAEKIADQDEHIVELCEHTSCVLGAPECRRWSRVRGGDIQLSPDLLTATRRPESARSGNQPDGDTMGLLFGAQPIRPVSGVRYFEVILEDVFAGPGGHSGLMVGISLSAPRGLDLRFHGWEVGGSGKLVRHRLVDKYGEPVTPDREKEISDSSWLSGKLSKGDHIGVMLTSNATLSVHVNGSVEATHAVEVDVVDRSLRVWPVVRLVGSSKTVSFVKKPDIPGVRRPSAASGGLSGPLESMTPSAG
mmetsp:Transcript_53907/g.143487  ORF Transcript_53907/g.143487 Transcript_53907/m.143487 type:complete len:514 (+) Transcript_53907:31-1572(+)